MEGELVSDLPQGGSVSLFLMMFHGNHFKKSQSGGITVDVTSLILPKVAKSFENKTRPEQKETKTQLKNRHTGHTVTRHRD